LVITEPDQLVGVDPQLLIELAQAPVAAEADDGFQLTTHFEQVAAMFSPHFTSHRCERGKLVEVAFNRPGPD
jgi:hypothetical protein